MFTFFIAAYKLFNTHRWALICLIVGIAGLSVYAISKIEFEEDISRMMPHDKKTEKLEFIFQNSKFMEKLVVNVTTRDTTQAILDTLMSVSDDFADSIKTGFMPKYVAEMKHKISDDFILGVYNLFYSNLPLFLDENDYKKMNTLLEEDRVKKGMAKNYKTMLSPASMVMKKFLLKDPLSFTTMALEKLQKLEFDENFEVRDGYIVTRDQYHLFLFLTPSNPTSETAENAKFMEQLDILVAKLEAKYNQQVKIEYFGSTAVGVSNASQIKKDVILTVSIVAVILLVFISIFFRRKFIFFLIFLPAVLGGGVSLAILYLLKTDVSAVALGIGSALLGITVDYALHFFTHFRHLGNVKTVLKDISGPIFMSSVTTAAAFLCLLFVKSEALQDLGLFAGISVICASFFSLLVLPHFATGKKNQPKSVEVKRKPGILTRFTSYNFDRNKWLIWLVVLATIVFFYTARFVTFETDMNKLSYVTEELQLAEQHLDEINNHKHKSVYLVASGKTLNDALIANEQIIGKVDSLLKAGKVSKYSSISTLFMSDELQREKIDSWNNFWTPEKRDTLITRIKACGRQYGFKEEAFLDFYNLLEKKYEIANPEVFSNLRQQVLDDYITETNNQTTVVTLLKVAEENKSAVYETFPDDSNYTILDKQYLTTKFIDLLRKDFDILVRISLIIVFLIITISFGRIEIGLITYIPMVVSWVWTLGIMGLLGIKFTIFNIIISTFIFGLGIDYSIFIMRGLLQKYKYGYDNLSSYKTSILLSAITTITGLGVLIFAKHPALQSIAVLSVIGIVSVVFVSYTLQPVLFRYIIEKKGKPRKSVLTLVNYVFSFLWYMYFILTGAIALLLSGTIGWLIPGKKRRKRFFHFLLMCGSRSTMFLMFFMKKRISRPENMSFKTPKIIICNHQSLIDIPLILMFHSKVTVLTTDWVQKSVITGMIAKFADFYPVSRGLDVILPLLKQNVEDGYSIFVFPEGTRSSTKKIGRFHKGAFYLAEKLNIPILPMVMDGSGDFVEKRELQGKRSILNVRFLDEIAPDDLTYGKNYSERTKSISKYFKQEYEKMCLEVRTPESLKYKLQMNYLYKGPLLEWYLKAKLRMEKNYTVFHELIPRKAKISDLGCGYGFLTYMLHFLSSEREIIAVDYDQEKIDIASNCKDHNAHTKFLHHDLLTYEPEKSDVFIMNDVLHYLMEEEQEKLIARCIHNLEENGSIIIRDGNSDSLKKHYRTKFTEFCSTKFGFNKTNNNLCFTSRSKVEQIVSRYGMKLKVVGQSAITSNEIYLIRKSHH